MERTQYNNADSRSDQAIEWLARLRAEDVTAAETAEFATWLAASSLNKVAFDDATVLWHQLRAMPRQSLPTPRQYSGAYHRRWPLAAAASFLLACVVMIVQLSTPVFSTGKGEQRRVILADGTTAFLNTNSSISVSYGGSSRRIDLQQGEVWFDVTKDHERPFIVTGRYATAEAVGTAFAVHETPDFTRIGVTEGVVAVHSSLVSQKSPAYLQVGQQSTLSATAAEHQDYDGPVALSWQRGQLMYEDVLLHDLLEDLNRYLPKKMVLSEPDLDKLMLLRITGTLTLDDQQGMLDTLKKIVPIRSTAVSDNLIIISSDR